jgi:iron complex outermembrane receptor protein
MTKSILLLSCAAGALTLSLGAGGAFAATATAAAADSSQSTTTVTDIVVVAERREQNLQKVPVAVSVFTAAKRDLIGINSVQDVTNFAPGFVYDPGNVHAYIRGVGRQSINVTDTSRIAAYEDEFYVYSAYELDKSSLFLTQEQIERGPQNVGGRNADGGSIDMISVRPTDEPYAEARATVANFGAYQLQGAISGQVTPGLDLRIAAWDNQQTQGYYKNVTGGPSEGNEINEWYVEGQLDAKPNDNTEFWLRAFDAGWNDRGDAGARGGFVGGSWDETNLTDANGYPGAGLFVNPNFGYAGYAGATRNSALTGPDASEVPILGSTTLLTPGITNNPSALNPNNFAAVQPRTDTLKGYEGTNYIFTYHFPTVDFKYLGGEQGYNYDLNFSEPDTDVTGFTLPGSTVPCVALTAYGLGGLNCPTAAPFLGASLPPASNLVINPLAHLEYIEDDWWTSHEFSFQSTDNGPLQWIGGLYYYFQHYNNPITLAAPGQANLANNLYTTLPTPFSANFGTLAAPNPQRYLFVQSYQISQSSIAAYGQVAWKISDDFKLTGNMRYTQDYKAGTEEARYNVFSNAVIDGLAPFYGAATPALDDTLGLTCPTGINTTATSCYSGKLAPGVTSIGVVNPNSGQVVRGLGGSSGALTGGAGAEWTPTPDIFVYARYNRGYEELTFNAGYVSSFPEVQPEDINSYEVGYKQAFGHSATIDIAGFYYDYDNMQLPISIANGGVTQSQFINVPKSVSTGVEFEGNWSPITDLLLTFTYSYDYTAIETGCSGTIAGGKLTPATINSLCVVDTNDPNAVALRANPFPGQNPLLTRDQSVKGNPLPQAPLNKVAFNMAYTWHFDPGSLTLSGSYVWRDVQDGTIFNRSYDNAPAWDDFDLRALWKGPNDKYEVIGFIKNIFNTLQYEVGSGGGGLLGTATSHTTAALGLDEVGVFSLAPPRTYGLEVRYKFF